MKYKVGDMLVWKHAKGRGKHAYGIVIKTENSTTMTISWLENEQVTKTYYVIDTLGFKVIS